MELYIAPVWSYGDVRNLMVVADSPDRALELAKKKIKELYLDGFNQDLSLGDLRKVNLKTEHVEFVEQ